MAFDLIEPKGPGDCRLLAVHDCVEEELDSNFLLDLFLFFPSPEGVGDGD